MKCSLKAGFVNILLIIFIASSEGVQFPLLLQTNSVIGEPMNFRQFRAVLNKLQDSFPRDVDFENNIHKIVKKQMAVSESGESRKRKRSVFSLPLGEGDGADVKDNEESKKAANNIETPEHITSTEEKDPALFEDPKKEEKNFSSTTSTPIKNQTFETKPVETPPAKAEKNSNVTQLQNPNSTTPKPKAVNQQKPKEKERSNATIIKENPNLKKNYMKVPDKNNCRCYYEFETNRFGCIKLRHKQCPEGQFFSNTTKKCTKGDLSQKKNTDEDQQEKKPRAKRHVKVSKFKRFILCPPGPPEDTDPSNEWLDATQGSRIPPEFKPTKKPELKIYHLIVRKKLNGIMIEKRNALGGSNADGQRNLETDRGPVKRQEAKTRRSKSFIIHIHKKAGKDESVAENDENDESEDEDEENDDEEDDEEEGEDEDDESDDEMSGLEITQKSPLSSKDAIKEFLKSAKEAVTNRARFDEGPIEPRIFQKNSSLKTKRPDFNGSIKSKKSDESGDLENKKKKVLIDANIKLDSTIGNALKSVLKGGAKEKQVVSNNDNNTPTEDEALISDRGSQDQMDPELIRMYEHLLRHNPRVKRHFQRYEKKLERFRKSR